MSKIDYVLVFDSGVGGLTTLSALKKTCPKANFLYLSDDKNCPYGNKSPDDLTHIISAVIKTAMKTHKLSAVVIACNTATTSVIGSIRSQFAIPIIGTEPNLKEPDLLGFHHITLMATPLTLSQSRTKFLEQNSKAKVHHVNGGNLAGLIENYILTQDSKTKLKIHKIIKSKLKYTPKFHAITLGCTHYVFFKQYIETTLKFRCFDGNLGVANRLKNVLNEIGYKGKESKLKFISSSLPHTLRLKQAFKRLTAVK
ncbi:MAG: glutamate racemase [Clostridia bacterium]|nr:glutamate racemase [Clostridia bacterium]